MRRICAYCGKDLSEGPTQDDDLISHAMCEACYHYYSAQWEGLSLSEYLDRFDLPVVIVDPAGRLLAANQPAADMMGKSRQEIAGLLGGDAMECGHARLPGGCGKTVHCKTCTIRRAVEQVRETGESVERVPATLSQQDATVALRISARRVGKLVRLIIEPAQ